MSNSHIAAVHSLSLVWLCNPRDCSTPGFPVLHHLLEFAQTHVHWIGDAIHPSHLLSSPFSSCPQSFSVSGSFLMSWLCIRWPEYWNFSFSISPSNEYSRLISSRIVWFDLLAVQGTLKESSSAPQFESISSSIWTFVGKVMSLLFNTLSGLVIAFLPRNKRLF